MCTSFVRSYN